MYSYKMSPLLAFADLDQIEAFGTISNVAF